ncbi:DUF2851 family protein [Jejudonia soesokkakensis]|uniref:DUF2851 family protein n=1 Tax=Jejudonia soesokkakensis TaxID=1323432 RepID=A0ABW2MU96_9FLAO
MKEDFLHYVWKFQKFEIAQLTTTTNELLTISNAGQHNANSGPDFFNARITIGNQQWAGNVELHIKASDWYVHQHEKDVAYDSVILHVVWEYDADIFRRDGTTIPTIVLKEIVLPEATSNYQNLFTKEYQFITCEQSIATVSEFTLSNWIERLYFERLEKRSLAINREVETLQYDWEALLFRMLAKGFGLQVNGEAFWSMASSLDFSIVRKCKSSFQLEALLFGQASLLETEMEDKYYLALQREYRYLQKKFGVSNAHVIPANYFRLRPPNFPTIRLSQLAGLYHNSSHLFSEVMAARNLERLYVLFDCRASEYWETHFNFQVVSKKKSKQLTKKFIDLLLINVVLPVKFCYASYQGQDVSEEIISLASAMPSEENTILTKFKNIGIRSNTALESQGLLELKKNYCDPIRCLHCAIGTAILKN